MLGAAAVGLGGVAALDALGSASTTSASEAIAPTEGQLGQFTRQLSQDGRSPVERSLRSLERRLGEHLTKLDEVRARGGDVGSVQREIHNFRGLIEAAKQVLGGPQ